MRPDTGTIFPGDYQFNQKIKDADYSSEKKKEAMQAEQEEMSNMAYLAELFGDSLLTGVPEITMTKSIPRKIFKIIVLFACIGGFIYQAAEFLGIFFEYPTNVDVGMAFPSRVDTPAITICNKNGIKKTRYCLQYPGDCTIPDDVAEICGSNIASCNETLKKKIMVAEAVYDRELKADRELLENTGNTPRPLINECKVYWPTDKPICNFDTLVKLPVTDETGGRRTCYTINSKAMSYTEETLTMPTYSKKVNVNNSAGFSIKLDLEPEEYFRDKQTVGGQVAIHSPQTLVNPFTGGFAVFPDKFYMIQLTVTKKKLLPAPYTTNCTDYNKLWKKRGGSGPLSREMCIQECTSRRTISACGCSPLHAVYPSKERFCDENDSPCTKKVDTASCRNDCQSDCNSLDFEYEVKERDMEVEGEAKKEVEETPTSKRNVLLMVLLKRPEVVVYTYTPKYESIELFSYLGGYVGMWLGISLLAIFDLAEILVRFGFFAFKKRQRRRKVEQEATERWGTRAAWTTHAASGKLSTPY